MDAKLFLAQCRAAGLTLRAEGNRVSITPIPAAHIIAGVREYRAELLALLAAEKKSAAKPPPRRSVPSTRVYQPLDLLGVQAMLHRIGLRVKRDGSSVEIFGDPANVEEFLAECGPSVKFHEADLVKALGDFQLDYTRRKKVYA